MTRLDGGDRGVMITRGAAQRIQRVVQRVDNMGRECDGISLRTSGDDGDPVRLGKTTAEWKKGTLATIEVYEDGTPPNETKKSPATTIEKCVNKSKTVPSDRWVLLGRGENGSWYLLEADVAGVEDTPGECGMSVGGVDLSTLPGYSAGTVQVLGHDSSNCLRWFSTTDCP